MSIADNLRRVQERIARAALHSGRAPDAVRLVAVTKYVDATAAAELVDAGCYDLAENRPQELWSKSLAVGELASASGPRIQWHLVGHLQRNKVRRTLPVVDWIHSVDSERLLAAIDAEVSSPQPIKVLLEVNISGESTKHGLAPEAVEPHLAAATRFPRVAICGLMTMAALEGGEAVAERNFASLRELRDRLQAVAPPDVRLDELSMGMSGDFEAAIRQGATMVRIGTALWQE